ncbi:MAG TPA: ABC transporter permease [Ruania sp.]|nr:ABC transporter permease [Ruania sp.]
MSVLTQQEPSLTRTPISWRWPIVYGVVTLITVVLFTVVPDGGTTNFRLAQGGDFFVLPDFAIGLKDGNLVLSVIMAALTVYATYRTVNRRPISLWVPLVFGTVFVLSFLVVVGSGRTTVIPLTALLAGALALSVPLIFGALSGTICERAGVINIAIEGQLLAGAFLAAVVASLTRSPYLGVVVAPIAGAVVGILLAVFAVRYWVDHIIVGVVLNVLVIGVTGFFYSTVLSDNKSQWNNSQALPTLSIPGLSDIPIIGPVLFDQTILVYLMYVIVIILQIYLFRSRWGLRLRSVGEHPKAADTVGVRVNATRVRNVILGGAIAGLGGAFFTVGSDLAFGKEMSAGQGYIALAAMILGRRNPKGAVAAALLFGFSRNLGNVMAAIGSDIPAEFLLMLPYAVTIVAVAGLVGGSRAPAALNTPYVK